MSVASSSLRAARSLQSTGRRSQRRAHRPVGRTAARHSQAARPPNAGAECRVCCVTRRPHWQRRSQCKHLRWRGYRHHRRRRLHHHNHSHLHATATAPAQHPPLPPSTSAGRPSSIAAEPYIHSRPRRPAACWAGSAGKACHCVYASCAPPSPPAGFAGPSGLATTKSATAGQGAIRRADLAQARAAPETWQRVQAQVQARTRARHLTHARPLSTHELPSFSLLCSCCRDLLLLFLPRPRPLPLPLPPVRLLHCCRAFAPCRSWDYPSAVGFPPVAARASAPILRPLLAFANATQAV